MRALLNIKIVGVPKHGNKELPKSRENGLQQIREF